MFFFYFDKAVDSIDNCINKIKEIADPFNCKDILIAYLLCIREEIVCNNISIDNKKQILSFISFVSSVFDKKKISEDDLKQILDSAKFIIEQINNKKSTGYNSDDFYNKEIENLKKQVSDFKSQIKDLKQDETTKLQLESELEEAQKLIKKYEDELEGNKKRQDAINNWKEKIQEAFTILRSPVSWLQSECNRLEYMYDIYAFFSILVIILLIGIEFVVYYKIHNSAAILSWEQYWPMVLPVPLAIGLLWGFITQMNRSQRQLVVLANQIYEIEYIEGLLLALNTLSVDVGESMTKINDAISRLIDNHLNNMFMKKIDENKLADIEKQNALPIDKIPDLIKLITKSKE